MAPPPRAQAFEKALALSGSQLSGRDVVIGQNTKPPKPRGAVQGSARVFVGNLPFEDTTQLESALRQHFGGCGKILFVRFAADSSGSSRGFCHVIFEELSTERGVAVNAALALDGSELLGRPISVGAASNEQKKPKRPPKREAPDADAEQKRRKEKALRPSEWRHDRAAGLTLPRKYRVQQEGGAAAGGAGWEGHQ